MRSNEQAIFRFQFLHVAYLQVECRLQHGALRGQSQHFVILVPEGGTYAPGVAHREHLAASRHATDDVAAVPQRRCCAEHVAHVDVLLDVAGDVASVQVVLQGNVEQALALAVQPVTQLFKQDEGVAVDARMLPEGGYGLEYLVDIGQVEVAAEAQVLGPPVVAAHKRMDKRKGTLPGG